MFRSKIIKLKNQDRFLDKKKKRKKYYKDYYNEDEIENRNDDDEYFVLKRKQIIPKREQILYDDNVDEVMYEPSPPTEN